LYWYCNHFEDKTPHDNNTIDNKEDDIDDEITSNSNGSFDEWVQ